MGPFPPVAQCGRAMRRLSLLAKIPAFLALWAALAAFMGVAGLVFALHPLWPAVIAQSGLILFGVALGGQWFSGTGSSATPSASGERVDPDRTGL